MQKTKNKTLKKLARGICKSSLRMTSSAISVMQGLYLISFYKFLYFKLAGYRQIYIQFCYQNEQERKICFCFLFFACKFTPMFSTACSRFQHWATSHLQSWKKGPGGSHIDMVYVYVPAFWGTFSQNLV